jgi:hypothetical protein
MLSFFSISESSEDTNNGLIDLGGHPRSSKELMDMLDDFKKDSISSNFEFQGYSFDKSSLLRLLSLEGCEGITFYLAKHKVADKDAFTIVSLPIDKDSKFITGNRLVEIDGQKIMQEGIYGEEDSTGHPPRILLEFAEKINKINS